MEELLESFGQLTHKKKCFKSSDEKYAEELRVFTKRTYDFGKSQEQKRKCESLPFLHIDGLDSEQIFQQVELLNKDSYNRLLQDCIELTGPKAKLEFEELQSSDEEIESDEDDQVDVVETAQLKNKEIETTGDSELEDEKVSDEEELNEVDSDEDEEEEIDFFSEIKFDDEIADMNAEFFGDRQMGEESEDDLETQVEYLENGGKKPSLSDEENDGEGEDEEDFENEVEKIGDDYDLRDKRGPEPDKPQKKDVKSTFELIEDRRKEKIKWLEDNALEDKDWYMKGEVKSKDRPENSALEEVLQFNVTSRPAPVITEETNVRLEDIIKRRIKDKAFDDVIRKSKPTETPVEFKKRLQLNQEKSKESLAQIYEKEYQKQVAAINGDNQEEEPPLFNEIRKLQHELFNQLDALSNYHFTPRPAIPQLKIVSNLPVLQMEEVGPVAENGDMTVLAPEQIAPKLKGDLIGKSERSQTDKLRERRKKKKFQKSKANSNLQKDVVKANTNFKKNVKKIK